MGRWIAPIIFDAVDPERSGAAQDFRTVN